jgi:CBS domain-containing protein
VCIESNQEQVMKVGNFCKRDVVVVSAGDSLADAARAMRDRHVGFLIVAETKAGRRIPVGVLTDRDIVVQVVARDVDPRGLCVGDVMTREPAMAAESDDLSVVLQHLRNAGLRRVPIVDEKGALAGVFAIDDAINVVSGLLDDIASAVARQQGIERELRVG